MSNELILLACGAMAAGFVQGLSGFAFGLVAMSFWVWGIEPRAAALMTVFGSLIGQLVAAFSVRRGWRPDLLLPFVLGGLAGVPLGVGLLPLLDADLFKLTIGSLLVVWCPVMLFAQQLPRVPAGGRTADALVGMAGGVMGGIGGITGVLPTLWCTLRGYDKDLQRSLIQNFNLAALSVAMLAHLVAGNVTHEMLPMFGIVAPALLLPALLGARVYTRLSEPAFRRLVLSLLTLSGAAMLATAVPRLLR